MVNKCNAVIRWARTANLASGGSTFESGVTHPLFKRRKDDRPTTGSLQPHQKVIYGDHTVKPIQVTPNENSYHLSCVHGSNKEINSRKRNHWSLTRLLAIRGGGGPFLLSVRWPIPTILPSYDTFLSLVSASCQLLPPDAPEHSRSCSIKYDSINISLCLWFAFLSCACLFLSIVYFPSFPPTSTTLPPLPRYK